MSWHVIQAVKPTLIGGVVHLFDMSLSKEHFVIDGKVNNEEIKGA